MAETSRKHSSGPFFIAAAVCGLLTSAGIAGCALLGETGLQRIRSANRPLGPSEDRGTMLPAIAPPGDSVQLEIVFVERPVSDPLWGPRLWQEVDEMASIPPRVRESLREHGFRVGMTGSSPPEALQAMLGLAEEIPEESGEEPSKRLAGRRVTLRSGAETEIQTTPYYQRCSVPLPGGKETDPERLDNVRCVFRVKVRRQQDGWAKLEFLPEVHHGAHMPRRTANEAGFTLRSSQEVEPLYNHRFSITLNLGEMVVLTAEDPNAKSLGRLYFVGPEESSADVQRLVVVRLANVIQKKQLTNR